MPLSPYKAVSSTPPAYDYEQQAKPSGATTGQRWLETDGSGNTVDQWCFDGTRWISEELEQISFSNTTGNSTGAGCYNRVNSDGIVVTTINFSINCTSPTFSPGVNFSTVTFRKGNPQVAGTTGTALGSLVVDNYANVLSNPYLITVNSYFAHNTEGAFTFAWVATGTPYSQIYTSATVSYRRAKTA